MNIYLSIRGAARAALAGCLTLAALLSPGRINGSTLLPSTLPVEVLSPGGIVTDYVAVNLRAATAKQIYLQVNNLIYPGMASVKLNTGNWFDLFNENSAVQVSPPFDTAGGIAGVARTIKLTLAINQVISASGAYNLYFRFNGTDGVASGFRVVNFDIRDASGVSMLTSTFPSTNYAGWRAAAQTGRPDSLTKGEILFNHLSDNTDGAILWDNPITKVPMTGISCADCHSANGLDLQYFGYSNEAIKNRALFHNLTQTQAEDIAQYVREQNGQAVGPGRPWNPPYQPGPDAVSGLIADLKANPGDNWAAGAGADAVLLQDSDMLPSLFPSAASGGQVSQQDITNLVSHTSETTPSAPFNVRKYPISILFPTWNQWLPAIPPKMIWNGGGSWNDFSYVYNLYTPLTGTVTLPNLTNLMTAFSDSAPNFIANHVGDPTGQWRTDLNNGDTSISLSYAVSKGIPQERAKQALAKWVGVKMFELVRTHSWETATESFGAYPEVLHFPGGSRHVFSMAPHIVADNEDFYKSSPIQPLQLGKLESTMWYQLQMTLNAGKRGTSVRSNFPVDWDYQIEHIVYADQYMGVSEPLRRLMTEIKLYQVRDNGVAPNQGTYSFGLRYAHPWQYLTEQHGDRGDTMGSLEQDRSKLANRVYEEVLREFLDVMRQSTYAVNQWTRLSGANQTDFYALQSTHWVPSNLYYAGGGLCPRIGMEFGRQQSYNHADATYTLIKPLLWQGIDPLLVSDLHSWAKLFWDDKAWTNPADPTYVFDAAYGPATYYKAYWDFESAGTSYPSLTRLQLDKSSSPALRNWGGFQTRTGYVGATAALAATPPPFTSAFPAGTTASAAATGLRVRALVGLATAGTANFHIMVHAGGYALSGPALSLSRASTLNAKDAKMVVYDGEVNFGGSGRNLVDVNLVFDSVSGSPTAYLDNVTVAEVVVPALATGYTFTMKSAAPFHAGDDEGIQVIWNLPVDAGGALKDPLAGFEVYRASKDANGNFTTYTCITDSAIGDDRYIDRSARKGVEYQYFAAIVDYQGRTVYSTDQGSSFVKNTATRLTVPTSPNGFAGTRGTGKITLTWTQLNQEPDTVAYEISRGAARTYLAAVNPSVVTYDDTTAPAGSTKYQIVAVDTSGNRSVISASPPSPATPTEITVP